MALNEQSNNFSNISHQDLESFIMDDNLGLKEEELFNLITGWVKNGYHGRASLFKYVRSNELNPRNPNEMVLAIGGIVNGWEISGDIKIGANFGIVTQPWRKTKIEMPVERACHGIGLINQMMYIFGGEKNYESGASRESNATFAFDLTKKTWSDKAPMNESRAWFASAILKHKIYACGGYNYQNGNLRSVEIYDPVLDVWGLLPSMTEVRMNAACVAFNNKIYVIGGYAGGQIHASVEIFNPATNEWSFGPPLQVPRYGAKAIVYTDKIFVIGGYEMLSLSPMKIVEVYDPLVSANWIVQQQQLTVGRSFFAVTLLDNKILISGGATGRFATVVTKKCETYDNLEWKETGPLLTARSGHAAVTLDDYTLNYKDFLE